MNFNLAFWSVLLFFALSSVFYLLRIVTNNPLWARIALRLTLFTLVYQLGVLSLHLIHSPLPLFHSYLDYFQISALMLGTLFVSLSFSKRFFTAGPVVLPLITLLCLLSLTYQNPYMLFVPQKGFGYLAIHLFAIFLSMSIFAIGLVSVLMYLISDRALKKKSWSGLVKRFPDLVTLDEIQSKATQIGFVLFTFVVLTGSGYSKVTTGHYFNGEFKQILSLVLWTYFAVLLNLRVRRGWLGRRGIRLSLIGLIGMVVLFACGV